MAPAHVEDKPIPRVVSKEETKEENAPPPAAPKADKKHEPPSFLRDLVLYAALGASLGAAFALAVPPLPPPPEAAPSRLLIKAPLATPPRAAANTQLLLAKDAEIERLRTEVKWALTDRGSDSAFKQELKAHEQRTQQMPRGELREKDARRARHSDRRAARGAPERQERRRRRGRPRRRRRAAPPHQRRAGDRRLRRAVVAAAVVVVLPPTRRALFARWRGRSRATAAAGPRAPWSAPADACRPPAVELPRRAACSPAAAAVARARPQGGATGDRRVVRREAAALAGDAARGPEISM